MKPPEKNPAALRFSNTDPWLAMSVVDPRSRQGRSEKALREDAIDADPLIQFQRWYDDALAAAVAQPEAMVLATAAPDGCISICP